MGMHGQDKHGDLKNANTACGKRTGRSGWWPVGEHGQDELSQHGESEHASSASAPKGHFSFKGQSA